MGSGSDGSNLLRLTSYSGSDWSPIWSPDGRHIAFSSDRGSGAEIYVMDSDGSNPRRLTYQWAGAFSPAWSPDGRHIAFVSYRDGPSEISVMGSDGSNLRDLTTAYHGPDWWSGWHISWSPDGRHIAFSSEHDDTWNIYVMDFREEGDSSTKTKKDRIVEVLFGLDLGEADAETYHDYNDYGNCPDEVESCDSGTGTEGYRGGHSGWDVQTKSVALDSTADESFYSLTSGQVIAIGGTYGKIAVYNAIDDKTTLYLHAREIYVSEGQAVNVGTALGIQGNVGLGFSDPNKNEHVHIEVRSGPTTYTALGADPIPASSHPTIDPVDYLYEAIQAQ